MRLNLERGTYIILIDINWKQEADRSSTLRKIYYKIFKQYIGAYSLQQYDVAEVSSNNFDLIQKNILKSYIFQNEQVVKKQSIDKVLKYSGTYLGMAFFYYVNADEEKRFREKSTGIKTTNLICII